MRIKFNKFERVAGLFVLTAILGIMVSAIFVALKRGWFAPKVHFVTSFENAEGLHPGTAVQIAGLRAGSVDDVELLSDNQVRVSFTVLAKFKERIREDSVAQLIRPFVIGDRVLDISVGTEEKNQIDEGGFILSRESVDMMSIFSGRKLGEYMELMTGMMENLRVLAEAFLDKKRTQSVVDTFDQIEPLVKNLNTMSIEVIKLSKQATKKENLGELLSNLRLTTDQVNLLLPDLKDKAPDMGKNLTKLVENLAILTENFKLLTPAIAEVAPELPKTSRRAVEALDEAVVLLKAMQKSIFIRGSVEEVREEEASREAVPNQNKKRQPAEDED